MAHQTARPHMLQQLAAGVWVTLRECTAQWGAGYLAHAEAHGSAHTLRLVTHDGTVKKSVEARPKS